MDILRNRNIWIAFFVWGLYWTFAPFMDRADLFDLVNGLSVALGIGVIIAYCPGGWRSLKLKADDMTSGHYLVLGVITVCSAFTVHRVWQWVWRWYGEPKWMSSHLMVGWFLWIIASGYVVHITSVGAIDGRIPASNWVRLAGWVVIGLTIGLIAAVAIN
jgi:hypothetical protein